MGVLDDHVENALAVDVAEVGGKLAVGQLEHWVDRLVRVGRFQLELHHVVLVETAKLSKFLVIFPGLSICRQTLF